MKRILLISAFYNIVFLHPSFSQEKLLENPSVFIKTPMELLCLKKHSPAERSPSENQSAFSNGEILDITIKDDSKLLSKENIHEFELILIKSIQAWNYACFNCSYNNLVLVKINDNYYMNSLLAALLRQANIKDKTEESKLQWLHPMIIDLDLDIFLFRRSNTSYGINYAKLDSNDTAIRSLCSTPTWWHLQPSIVSVRNFLCKDKTKLTKSTSKFTIEIRDDYMKLNRKGGENEVAFGDKNGIKLNSQNFYFKTENNKILFGNPNNKEVNIFPLITHEMGHWIGIVGHIDNSIIAQGNFNVPCIDDRVLDLMQKTITKIKTKRKFKSNEVFVSK